MAKIIGQSARFISEQAARKRRRILMAAFSVIAILGVITGLVLSSFVPLQWMDNWVRLALMSLAMLAIVAVDAWGENQLNITQKRSDALLRAAVGEIQVGNILGNLPDEFQVINDFSMAEGSISHIVIGPTGIFLLETKNWRGTVTSDGNGELLLNGHPTERQFVRCFAERADNVIHQLSGQGFETRELTSQLFVFTSARTEMKQEAVGKITCLADDKLYSHIVEKEVVKVLSPREVTTIAQAFLRLAHNVKTAAHC